MSEFALETDVRNESLPFDINDFVTDRRQIFKGLTLRCYGSITLEELEQLKKLNTEGTANLVIFSEVLSSMVISRSDDPRWTPAAILKLPQGATNKIQEFFLKEFAPDPTTEGNAPPLTGAQSTGDSISTIPPSEDSIVSISLEPQST
jgi:hypothetical protein